MTKIDYYYNIGKEKYRYNKENDFDYGDNHYIQELSDSDPNFTEDMFPHFIKGWVDSCEDCKS